MRVLVTRPAEQAQQVCGLLAEAGFEPVTVPAIRTEAAADLGALDAALRQTGAYRWVVFASATAVRIVAERMAALGIGPAEWDGVKILAGTATAQALAVHGLTATRVLAPFSARAALEALDGAAPAGTRVLLPGAEGGREELGAGLRARGVHVDEVPIYRTVPLMESPALLRELEGGVDAVLFFSPSAVRGVVAASRAAAVPLDRALGGAIVACVGATTAGEARAQGLPVDVVPPDTTAASLVAALASHATARPQPQTVGAAR